MNLEKPRDFFRGVDSVITGVPRNVLLFNRDNPKGHPRTHHRRYVMSNCLQGTGTLIIDGNMHVIAPNHGILIFPFQGHEYGLFAPGPVAWLYVTFDFDNEECLKPLRNVPYQLDKSALKRLQHLTENFLSAKTGDNDTGDILGFRVGEILAHLVRRADQFAARAPDPSPSPQHKAVREAIYYVHENIGHRLTVADVAAHVSLSPSRLMAIFKEGIGTSLGEFVIRARMHRANALLAQSDMNISEVAAACGFDSIYSFSRCFRQRRGMPPTSYRQSLRRS